MNIQNSHSFFLALLSEQPPSLYVESNDIQDFANVALDTMTHYTGKPNAEIQKVRKKIIHPPFCLEQLELMDFCEIV